MRKTKLKNIIKKSIKELYAAEKRKNTLLELLGLPTSKCGKKRLQEDYGHDASSSHAHNVSPPALL